MTNLTQIALYCRVSTDEQAHEGVSLSEQQARLKSYCASQGWDRESGLRLYVDDGYSGKNLHRPALERLLEDLQTEPFVRLLVTKLDRLSRRLLDLLSLIELLEGRRVSLVSTSEAFDTATPSGRLTLQVLGAVAEFERERIRERVIDNMAHAAKSGKWLAKPPYGYQIVEKALVEYAPEAEVVRRVFALYTKERAGYFQIAKRLNEEGVTSREKKAWSSNTIKKILGNPAYVGTAVWNRKGDAIVMAHAHPALIEQGQFEQAKARAARGARAKADVRRRHLLSGILRCSLCGSRMYSGNSGNRGQRRVYRCSSGRSGGDCPAPALDATRLESAFLAALATLLQAVEADHARIAWQIDAGTEQRRLQKRAQQYAQQKERLLQAYLSGAVDAGKWQEEQARIEAKMSKWDEALAVWREWDAQKEQALTEARALAADLPAAISALPMPDLREWLGRLVESVTVVDGSLQIRLTPLSDPGS